MRRELGFENDDGIEEARLVGESNGLSGIEGKSGQRRGREIRDARRLRRSVASGLPAGLGRFAPIPMYAVSMILGLGRREPANRSLSCGAETDERGPQCREAGEPDRESDTYSPCRCDPDAFQKEGRKFHAVMWT